MKDAVSLTVSDQPCGAEVSNQAPVIETEIRRLTDLLGDFPPEDEAEGL